MSETLTSAACFEHLKRVIDPEIYQNIVDLGLVYGVDVNENQVVDVRMTLTTPHCPLGPQIIADVQNVLLDVGASDVMVNIVWDPPWTPDAMTDDLKRQLGILMDEEEEPEPEPVYVPPPPPQKKGLFSRLLGR